MAKQFFIGIDPGKSGAMAIYDKHTNDMIALGFDKEAYLEELEFVARHDEPAVCCLEHVGAMPGQGVTSMFNFGENFGWIQGVLEAFKIPYELVRPQKWKNEFSITSDKNSSIDVCRRLYPHLNLKRTEHSRKDDDNLAEAALMATYAFRKL